MPLNLLIENLMYKLFIKYFLDLLLAVLGLIIISPLFLFITFLLFIVNKGNVFFYQERPGKNARIFKLVKFKTMNDNVDIHGVILSDSHRLTKIGKIIRSTSLDELPQLLNVIKGDMSLIGPRPLLVKYLPLYNKKQSRRHEVRPGISGWAQVNGRNTITWPEKFEYDIYYVDNISFTLDFKILFLTIKKILLKEGINSGPNSTMQAFSGNLNN
jgi:lipopolysaccharide/colanic/teichoic acid biosynthesis glycosyltransferase